MNSFGKKLAECRKQKDLSQKELASLLETSHSVIGKYERDEMTPSIEAAKKLARILDTTVGYLLGETEDDQLLRDNKMLQRLKDIEKMPPELKDKAFFFIDMLIRDYKTHQAYAESIS